jgi:hypothetical protein
LTPALVSFKQDSFRSFVIKVLHKVLNDVMHFQTLKGFCGQSLYNEVSYFEKQSLIHNHLLSEGFPSEEYLA